MTEAEAIRECEFWTTNQAGTVAMGSTRNPEIGLFFNVPPAYQRPAEEISDPHGPRYFAINVGRSSPVFEPILAEIERRKS